LLQRALDRPLERESPGAQIAPDGADLQPHAALALDQRLHRRPRPQQPGDLELIRATASDQARDPRLLNRGQRLLLTGPPATPALGQRPPATAAIAPHPTPDHTVMDAQRLGDLNLRPALLDHQPHTTHAQHLLSILAK